MNPATPPKRLRLRTASLEDAGAIADLVNEVTVAEIGVPWTDAGQISDDLTSPSRLSGLDDLLLVDHSGQPVGCLGFVVTREPFEVDMLCSVRPALWGRGVNAWLLKYGEERAVEHRPSDAPFVLSVGRFLGNDAAGRLFEALGYAYARSFRTMRLDLDAPPDPAAIPTGITIRTFDRRSDERRAFNALSEAFADHWGVVSAVRGLAPS